MARRLISDFTVSAGDHLRFYADVNCTQRIDVFDAGTGGTDYGAWYTAPTGGVVTGLWLQDGYAAAWARVENPTSGSAGSPISLTLSGPNPAGYIVPTDVSDWASNVYIPAKRAVWYQGVLYRCNASHTTGGSFDATKFDADGSGTYLPFKTAALNPDLLISGAITRDGNGAATSAPVVWPDGITGTYTADTVSTAFPGAVDAYHITYGTSPVVRTYTQAAVTRDSSTGAVTNRPALTVA
jgi:hypothetical protein